jgi:hypothetical protein
MIAVISRRQNQSPRRLRAAEPAADPAATAGFIGRWWSLEHSKSPMIQLKNHRQKCE